MNQTSLEGDVFADSTYNDSYTFSDDGITYNIQVPEDKIGLIIGSKGSTVNEIREKTGCKIEMVKDAHRPGCVWTISSANSVAADEAVTWIQELISQPPLGSVHDGVVVNTTEFGVFVSFGRREGLIRHAQLGQASSRRTEASTDVLHRGDPVRVSVTGIDHRGRICLALVNSMNFHRGEARQSSTAVTKSATINTGMLEVTRDSPSRLADKALGTTWPSLGGQEERATSVGQYAAWSQRVKEQRERARSEAEMRKAAPPQSRDLVPALTCSPKTPAGATTQMKSQGGPGHASHFPATVPLTVNKPARTDSVSESATARKVRNAVDSDLKKAPGGKDSVGWVAEVSNGYAGGLLESAAVTRRELKGDADYSRDYTRYAPSAASSSGLGSTSAGRVQRMSDRDGGEEGGDFALPRSGVRGRGRGRDR